MSRIEEKLKDLKMKRRKALVFFLPIGEPDLLATEKLVLELERSGADIIELGIPCADSLADGPTIQSAYQKALDKHKINIDDCFALIKKIRQQTSIPLVCLSNFNLIFNYGQKEFTKKAYQVGLDGLIIADLPPEEAKEMKRYCQQFDLDMIFLLAPTSHEQRIKDILEISTGFIYLISLTGTTGARKDLPEDLISLIVRIKERTEKAIFVGFGISEPRQAKEVAQYADGVIIGSALVKIIARHKNRLSLVKQAGNFCQKFKRVLTSSLNQDH